MGGSVRQRKKGKSKKRNSNIIAGAANAANGGSASSTKRRMLVAVIMSLLVLAGVISVTLVLISPWSNASPNEQSGPTPSSLPPSSAPPSKQPSLTRVGSFELLETVPHDDRAFTQGLLTVTDDGSLKLYESTGMYGASDLRLLDLEGTVLAKQSLPPEFFAEGIAHFPSDNELRITQLTWRETTSFEYVIQTNNSALLVEEPVANWTYQSTKNEGWGITYDTKANVFYMTDGSQYLHTWDVESRSEITKIPVRYQTAAMETPSIIRNLNELEYDPATNTVLSNVWFEDILLRIDIDTGFVSTMYDFTSLFPKATRPARADVFNGVALTYDALKATPLPATTDEFWVTGKYWPSIFRVRLIEPAN